MAKIIALTNQKGGVGKTTTCCAICGGLAQMGKKVLAIDLDPQGNLSFSLGIDDEDAYTMMFSRGTAIFPTLSRKAGSATLSLRISCFPAWSLNLPALGASISSGNRWKLSATSTTT